MHQTSVFIITYGRTGSTLLQGILNSHPNVLILGENFGYLYSLYTVLSKLEKFKDHSPNVEAELPTHPFYGATQFDFDQAKDLINTAIRDFFSYYNFETENITHIGFKDVRYDMPDIENYLDFLKDSFDNAKFIFLTRDISSVVKSGFFKLTNPQLATAHIEKIHKRFAICKKSLGDTITYSISYDDLQLFEKVKAMFAFLGLGINYDAWSQVISISHSYDVQSLHTLDTGKNFVVLDSAKRHLEAFHFEYPENMVKLIKSFALQGVIMPYEATGKLLRLVFESSEEEYEADIGLLSPGYKNKYPNNPYSSHGRFKFMEQTSPPVENDAKDYYLVGDFEYVTGLRIARLG